MKKRLAAVLVLSLIISVFSGCNLASGSSKVRPQADPDSGTIKVDEPVNGDSLYVTGIEDTISMKDSDGKDAETLEHLKVGDMVKFIDDDSSTCFYVSYPKNDTRGYIKKEYLTPEKSAVCKRQNAYISDSSKLMDSNDKVLTTLSKNDKIFIVSKNSGEYWFIYHKNSKTFGYVESRYIAYEPIKEESAAPSQAAPKDENYIGSSNKAPSIFVSYYVSGVSNYLGLRSERNSDGTNIIGKMFENEEVYVINDSYGEFWYCYSPKLKMYGYANSNYLVDENHIATPRYVGKSKSEPPYYDIYYVSGVTDSLALRSHEVDDPDDIIGNMYEGDKVYVVDETNSGFWYCYSPKLKMYGYANSNFLSDEMPKEYPVGGPAEDSGEGYAKYYVKGVNNYLGIRSKQSKDQSNIIGKAYEGELVYVIDSDTGSNYWYCYAPGCKMYGFADSNYLTTQEPVQSSEPVESQENIENTDTVDSDDVSENLTDIISDTVSDISSNIDDKKDLIEDIIVPE